MRKTFMVRVKSCLLVVVMLFSFVLYGCDLLNGGSSESSSEIYTIMYSDGDEVHTLSVAYGELYAIERPFPSREGYDFSGLYDAEVSGTQYITATGVCVSPFYERKNIVLYPQFTAKTYTLLLDYGEAIVTGAGTLQAKYGSELPQFPAGLTIPDKHYMNFAGWYTQPDCRGIKVAGADGVSGMLLSEELANLGDENRTIRLYAGFQLQTFSVRFYANDRNTLLKEAEAEYGTNLSEVAPKETEDGKIVSSWATMNGVEYDGIITGNLEVYVLAYECRVIYDYAYGDLRENIVLDNGLYTLEVPEREGYTFEGWFDEKGNRQPTTIEVTDDLTLTARWKANTYTVTCTLDETEGEFPEGTESTYSVAYGTAFKLPVPDSKNDIYEFAGWFTARGRAITDSRGNSVDVWDIAENTELFARFREITYTVGLDSAGGTGGGTREIVKGTLFSLPTPTRTGYSFVGWFDGSGRKYEGSFYVNMDIFLTARWQVNEYRVIYNASGGNLPQEDGQTVYEKTVVYGQQFSLSVPVRSGYTFVGWYTSPYSTGTRLTDQTGAGLRAWNTPYDITAYAQWVTDYVVALDRSSCKQDNGYNPAEQGTDNDKKTHSAFELLELIVSGSSKNDQGEYFIPGGSTLSLSLKLLEDPSSLPKSGGIGANWYRNALAGDTWKEGVYGTNLTGKTIGKGAYYVKVSYTDGSYAEFNGTDFMNGMAQGDVKGLTVEINPGKRVSSIELMVVYEIIYSWYDGWWHDDYSNWRCTATLEFEK